MRILILTKYSLPREIEVLLKNHLLGNSFIYTCVHSAINNDIKIYSFEVASNSLSLIMSVHFSKSNLEDAGLQALSRQCSTA